MTFMGFNKAQDGIARSKSPSIARIELILRHLKLFGTVIRPNQDIAILNTWHWSIGNNIHSDCCQHWDTVSLNQVVKLNLHPWVQTVNSKFDVPLLVAHPVSLTLNRPSSLNNSEQNDNDGYDQQDVDQRADVHHEKSE